MSPCKSKDAKRGSGSRVSPQQKARVERTWKAVREAGMRPLAPARPLTPPSPPIPREPAPARTPTRMSGAELLSIKNLLSPMSPDSPSGAQSHDNNVNSSQPKAHSIPPRAFCSKCNQVPGGFKTKNELRRHARIKHSDTVKTIVIRVGAESHYEIKRPFGECFPCVDGKGYNADYAAVEHLRRVHFNPIMDPGGKRLHGDRWPPMHDLKVFLEERIVRVHQGKLPGPGELEGGRLPPPRQELPETLPELSEVNQEYDGIY